MATTNRAPTPDVLGAMLTGGAGALKQLRATEIRLDGGTQPRAGVDPKHVQELAADVENGAVLPPLDVTYDGAHYWLWDGYHRLAAWRKLRGDGVLVDVRVHQGSQADAQWASYAANRAHGLRRTNEDKARAVQAALKHPNGASRSNREIGRYLGVDEGTVRHWREKLEAGAEIPPVTQRTGADGKTYDTSGIGAAKQARAASFGEYMQAVRVAMVAATAGEGSTTQQQLRWLTVTTVEGLMASAPGDDRAAVEKARRLVLADLVAVVKAQQAATAAAAAGPRQASAIECYAAVWRAVRAATLALGAAERLQVVVALKVADIRAQLPRGVVADDVALAGARLAVETELRNQADHEAKKAARRGSGGSGGGGSFSATSAASVAQPGPAKQAEPAETSASSVEPPTTGDDSASSSTDERTAKLHRLKLLFMQCTDALTLWSQMTGREVITLEARRGLRAVIDTTSDLIDGKVEEGVEVAA